MFDKSHIYDMTVAIENLAYIINMNPIPTMDHVVAADAFCWHRSCYVHLLHEQTPSMARIQVECKQVRKITTGVELYVFYNV